MSQLVARILLTIFMLPLAIIVYGLTATCCESHTSYSPGREDAMFLSAGLAMWTFVAIYWLLLWHRQIKWTRQRKVGTVLLSLAAVTMGMFIGVICSMGGESFGVFMGSITSPLIWLMGTILLWRETKAERCERLSGSSADVVFCATCGYNLTGLSEARCPECGTKFTLNELFSRQPHREAAKLDQEIVG